MINRVIIMGRLVADPELKATNTGVSVTSFRIAVDRSYVKQGEERQADFIDIVAWRATAEFVCRNFSKGSLIAIDGQLQSRQYQTKDGQNRTAIEVVAENVSFTGERREVPSTYGGYAPTQQNAQQNAQQPTQRQPQQYAQPQQYQQQYAQQNAPQHAQQYAPPQTVPGATYDPRSQQGMIPQTPYTPNDDLPF